MGRHKVDKKEVNTEERFIDLRNRIGCTDRNLQRGQAAYLIKEKKTEKGKKIPKGGGSKSCLQFKD